MKASLPYYRSVISCPATKTMLMAALAAGAMVFLVGCGCPNRTAPESDNVSTAPVDDGYTLVESSLIEAVKYNPNALTLSVRLKNGKTYDYLKVRQDNYDHFMAAASKGSYYTQHIRDEHEVRQR